jgi:hypothetical protein
MTRHARLGAGFVVALITSACGSTQFTPRQEWVYTKFPECKNRTNAINVTLERVEPDGRWHTRSAQTQTDFNLVATCMQQEWTAQQERLDQDDAEALRWYRAGVDRGDAWSMTNLGFMYEAGKGVPKDEGEAVIWYRKGAERGNAAAMFLLGRMYESGKGRLTTSRAEAVSWYRKAATAGYEPATKRLRALGEEP